MAKLPFLPSLESSDYNAVRVLWDRLSVLPGGTRAFSKAIGLMAPYTGTIHGHIVELRDGYARVEMNDRKSVRNHLRSIHAIALVNLAELAGNIAVAYSLPADARFIVAGLSIEYAAKARGTLSAVCEAPLVTSSERCEYAVPVRIYNSGGDLVASSTLRTLVGPKKKSTPL